MYPDQWNAARRLLKCANGKFRSWDLYYFVTHTLIACVSPYAVIVVLYPPINTLQPSVTDHTSRLTAAMGSYHTADTIRWNMVRRSTIRREMKVSFDTAAQRLVLHGKCRASVMRYRCYRQMAHGYLSELRRPVSALLGRRHLRSAGRGHLDFPPLMESGRLPTLTHLLGTHCLTTLRNTSPQPFSLSI